MVENESEHSAASALRALVESFIQERLNAKLDKLKEDESEKRQELLAAYQREVWLEDAARRVNQIQLVTHALKYTHPSAQGTSLYAPKGMDGDETPLVGTFSLGAERTDDVVGNAAALDVYKFLKLSYEGKTLLARVLDKDPALIAAFSDDQVRGQHWVETFATITQDKNRTASHKLAKQLYFPLDNKGDYHLLAPLFSTSLVHGVYRRISEDRFGEAGKAAREARREGKPFAHGFREYPNLAVQKFGGTKPQNVSQLNSERHGENWLLASLPPTWHSEKVRPPLSVKTVFGRWFGRRRSVRELTQTLRQFLTKTAYTNVRIRQTRAALVNRIADELVQFAAEVRELPPGWSKSAECRLDAAEAYWLDPGRTREDADFALQRQIINWQDEICARFGNWLNRELQHDKLPLGEAEQGEWKGVLDKMLGMIRIEIAHDE